MSNADKSQLIRIELTPEQQEAVRATTHRTADAIELTVRELEERIAPRLSSNHNETFLSD